MTNTELSLTISGHSLNQDSMVDTRLPSQLKTNLSKYWELKKGKLSTRLLAKSQLKRLSIHRQVRSQLSLITDSPSKTNPKSGGSQASSLTRNQVKTQDPSTKSTNRVHLGNSLSRPFPISSISSIKGIHRGHRLNHSQLDSLKISIRMSEAMSLSRHMHL